MGRQEKFNDQQLVELLQQGKDVKQIASLLKVGITTVYRRIELLDDKPEGVLKAKRKLDVNEFTRLVRDNNYSVQQLAQRFNYSVAGIRKILHRHNLKVARVKKTVRAIAGYWNEDEMQQMILDYNRTKSELIFNKIYPTLQAMTEAIWTRYFASRNISFNTRRDEIFNDALALLATKLYHYKPSKGRTYSFCQTVIKNYFNSLVSHKSWSSKLTDVVGDFDLINEAESGMVIEPDMSAFDDEHYQYLKSIWLKQVRITKLDLPIVQELIPLLVKMIEDDRIFNPYYVNFIIYIIVKISHRKIELSKEPVL